MSSHSGPGDKGPGDSSTDINKGDRESDTLRAGHFSRRNNAGSKRRLRRRTLEGKNRAISMKNKHKEGRLVKAGVNGNLNQNLSMIPSTAQGTSTYLRSREASNEPCGASQRC